jgi:hypothetical protein
VTVDSPTTAGFYGAAAGDLDGNDIEDIIVAATITT